MENLLKRKSRTSGKLDVALVSAVHKRKALSFFSGCATTRQYVHQIVKNKV